MALDASTPVTAGGSAAAVTGAIRGAAQATGTSFSYLLATAKIESGLDPNMTMTSSSATGLFQFIDQTWLGTLKQAGPAFGYGAYANAISRNASGHYVVQDPQMRREIMRLRNDPAANATMAGAFTQQNAALLTQHIGRRPTDGELYIAHFFGPGGAAKLIQASSSQPQATAADMFPQAAHANRSIFYDRQGNARSVAGVYSELVRRFTVASNNQGGTTAGGVVHQAAVAAPKPPVNDTAGFAKALADASNPRSSASADQSSAASVTPSPTFSSLFSDPDRRAPVSPVVAALWSTPSADEVSNSAQYARGPDSADKSRIDAPAFNLFQDGNLNARGLFSGGS